MDDLYVEAFDAIIEHVDGHDWHCDEAAMSKVLRERFIPLADYTALKALVEEMAAIAREIGEDVPAEFVADGTPTRARQAHAYKAGVFDRVHLRAKVASTKYNTFRETANVGQS